MRLYIRELFSPPKIGIKKLKAWVHDRHQFYYLTEVLSQCRAEPHFSQLYTFIIKSVVSQLASDNISQSHLAQLIQFLAGKEHLLIKKEFRDLKPMVNELASPLQIIKELAELAKQKHIVTDQSDFQMVKNMGLA